MEGRALQCQNMSVRPASPLSFHSLNIQLPPLRHSSASLKEVTPSLQSSWEVFISSKQTSFNIPLFLLSITMLTTLLRGCWDPLFVETALKQQRSVITRWFRSKPHAQINDGDLIWTRQLRPLVKVSLFCWRLIPAREHKQVQWVFIWTLALLLLVTGVVTKEEELLCSKAVLPAGVLIVAHWLCQILQQPGNFYLSFFG